MRKNALILVLTLLLACLVACKSPEPTPTPAQKAEALTKPTATEPASKESALLAQGSLTLYSPAMRPAFLEDLAALGPLSRYRLEITVDPEHSQVSGREIIQYANTDRSAQTDIYLRLFPNLPGYGGEMTVSNLSVDGEPVDGILEVADTALRLPLPSPVSPGAGVTIDLEFSVRVPQETGEGYGQFIFSQDIMALANFYPLIPAYDEENCSLFGNCNGGWNIEHAVPYGDAVFSDTALYEVLITAPAGWQVAASGSTIDMDNGPHDTVTWHVVSGPMRDFNLVLSPRFEVATRMVEDIAVNTYYLPEDVDGGQRVLDWSADALAFFNERFGPYPFAEFDIVETPTTAGGIEYPGLIVMPIRNYDQTGGYFQWATVHEVAHQWWYSMVGNDQQDEPWLDEAITQYSTALFYEFVVGWDAAVEEVFESRYQEVAGTDEDDLINRPVADYTYENYGPVVYAKGPLFIHALRQEMGTEEFFSLLQTYLKTWRYQVASGQDFLTLADQIADQELSDLFQEWGW